MKRLLVLICIWHCSFANATDRLPIIDMHMHAFPADAEGPPPLAMCTPLRLTAWDPEKPFGAVFMNMAKQPACDDPVWSPETHEEVLAQTLQDTNRRNIFGVLSGTPERVTTDKGSNRR